MYDPHILSEIISEDVSLNLIEPDIYSVYSIGNSPGSYDSIGASTIYDVVACNRFYNWLMWGYSVKDYAALCENSLASSSEGWVLDLACGSLAFTAEIYANFSNRPVWGTFVQSVHNSKLMSSISGFFPVDIIRVTQELVTPRYLATSAPE